MATVRPVQTSYSVIVPATGVLTWTSGALVSRSGAAPAVHPANETATNAPRRNILPRRNMEPLTSAASSTKLCSKRTDWSVSFPP